MHIGLRVKQLRKSLGLTQQDLATKCGYKSLTTINKIELGINNVPLDTIEKLASALQTTPSYLMGWEEPAKEESKLVSLIDQLTEEEVEELSKFVDYLISKRK